MIRTIVLFATTALAGAVLGVGMAIARVAGAGFSGADTIDVDGWRSDWSIGAPAANALIRAGVARRGLLALAKEEAVYFTRTTDDAGDPLREACDYRLSGAGQDAYWWSITLYDSESRLPMNDDAALSIDATRQPGDAPWEAYISARRPPGDMAWISSRNAGGFDLTLRLYEPSEAVLDRPRTALKPPSITRLGCDGDDA